jgi:H+/Cl- antiporter ClcA
MAGKRTLQPHTTAQREQELELHREIRPQLALAALGALLVGVAYLLLPDSLTVGPNWLLLAIEAVVLSLLTIAAAAVVIAALINAGGIVH